MNKSFHLMRLNILYFFSRLYTWVATSFWYWSSHSASSVWFVGDPDAPESRSRCASQSRGRAWGSSIQWPRVSTQSAFSWRNSGTTKCSRVWDWTTTTKCVPQCVALSENDWWQLLDFPLLLWYLTNSLYIDCSVMVDNQSFFQSFDNQNLPKMRHILMNIEHITFQEMLNGRDLRTNAMFYTHKLTYSL